MVEGVLRGRCHLLMRVSQGPLASKSNPSELLLAPVEAYQATEASYLSELVGLSPSLPWETETIDNRQHLAKPG